MSSHKSSGSTHRREKDHGSKKGDRHRRNSSRNCSLERKREKHSYDHRSKHYDKYSGKEESKYVSHHRREDSRKGWSFYGYTEKDLAAAASSSSNQEDVTHRTKEESHDKSKNDDQNSRDGVAVYEPEITSTRQKLPMKGNKSTVKDEESKKNLPFMFDWKRHKQELDKLFFTGKECVISKGSQEYYDFWKFLEKYLTFQARQKMKNTSDEGERSATESKKTKKLNLPKKYNKRYKVNVNLKYPSRELLSRYGDSDDEDEESLTTSKLKEFRTIYLYYLDFCQKQQFNKLVKLKTDQANLPIAKYRNTIITAVEKHRVVLIAGDTGCGKSTQVPQYLMAAGFDRIACTQPRRIACISLAKRVSFETLNEYGDQVGYQIRFEAQKSSSTKIIFLTEGLLLRQIQSDPHLSQYNVIVLDEVHERHLQGDFLLGILHCLLEQREDSKIVLMSATINIELFSNYFENAPVIQVPGRLYPIQLEFVGAKEGETQAEKLDPRPYLRIMQRIDYKYPSDERGDLLIFMSGMREISTLVEAAKVYASQTERWIVLSLHSSLSIAEQDKVFDIAPEGVRKCIVSTNIAETSVTIDGVRFIIDSGKVKEMSYNAQAKMQQLQEFWISQASAEQRKGRAGRTGPGVCFRLYTEADFEGLQEYSTPEIQRVPLDSLVLQMLSLGMRNPRVFPFIEPPPIASMETSITFLKEQGAIDSNEELTAVGRMLANLPVDVVIGKMLIMGTLFQMTEPVLCIAASLSVQSPFTNKAFRDADAMTARKPLESDNGDPFTLLNAFNEWVEVKAERGSGSRKWCKRRCLEEQRFYEMSKLKQQFSDLLRDHNMLENRGQQSEKQYSVFERLERSKDRKTLNALKRSKQKNPRKRKVLKLELGDTEMEEDEEDEDDERLDISHLEFKLSHNLDKMQATVRENRRFSLRELNILKVILCSGLYPQLAIADDCNSYRKDSDQVFHTKAKSFVVLHPNSIFANNPALIQPPEPEDENLGLGAKGPLSSKHSLLAYVSLLETNKPYLVSTMKVPALQTLLLYARSVDTNMDCTRIVADDWLEFTFPNSEDAQLLVSAVLQLRSVWARLLEMKLKETEHKGPVDGPNLQIKHQERLLASKLAEFLDSDIKYTMKKTSQTELQTMYMGPSHVTENEDSYFTSQSKNATPHPIKGGYQIKDFFVYGCLADSSADYTSVLRKHWTCPVCNQAMIITTLERLEHEASCTQQEKDLAAQQEEEPLKSKGPESLRRNYDCPICKEQFSFTTSEILKHKKSHQNMESNATPTSS